MFINLLKHFSLILQLELINNMKLFGNDIKPSVVKKAERQKKKYANKFKHNPNADFSLRAITNPVLGEILGVKNIIISDSGEEIKKENSIVVGTIRMGYGHYRISMAIASAANSMGITPYWFDLLSFEQTTGAKIINHLNYLYSYFSRLSRKSRIINYLFERETAGVHKKLSCNVQYSKMNELMAVVYRNLPKEIPFVGAHSWPSQAAVHANMKHIVNAIPDNCPLGLHLAEGALQTVQTYSALMGYRVLKNMDTSKATLNPIPKDDITYTGHYVDHELVSNIEIDCARRLERIEQKKPRRFLASIGGAGAEGIFVEAVIEKLALQLRNNSVTFYINAGDHKDVFDFINNVLKRNNIPVSYHEEWNNINNFCNNELTEDKGGVHLFYSKDIFSAIYTTNLLMRFSDILLVKPSEFSFYPIPKLMIKRVGGHEAWGAIHTSELGDGTIECETIPLILQAVELLVNEDELIKIYCNNILTLHKAGTYNGAYNVVKLAMNHK